VTDTKTGKSIVVKVNDRGPFVKGRIIDLSRSAARELGMIKKGLAKVEVEVLSVPKASGS
jgi:rare lipoprotein A